ncbi:hypothetical protein P9847_15210 [Paenibacillus chibensis]|uniref:Uncharacterized protein n=1 Tax=Paenibacillus chibensis TaxID=59846 RepID=A0ABU6PWW5_9BACL|nr:hypothetical protein [Paenibacillus chibensis]
MRDKSIRSGADRLKPSASIRSATTSSRRERSEPRQWRPREHTPEKLQFHPGKPESPSEQGPD